MTKLLEWLAGTSLFFAVWLSIVMNDLNLDIVKEHTNIVVSLPLIVLVLFGVSTYCFYSREFSNLAMYKTTVNGQSQLRNISHQTCPNMFHDPQVVGIDSMN